MSWRLALVALMVFGLAAVTVTDTGTISSSIERPVAIAALPCLSSVQTTSSGYVLDDGLVVTVAHAIYESRDFAVRDFDGAWHGAEVVYMDLERDLALVRVDQLSATPAPVAAAEDGLRVRMIDGASSGTVAGQVARPVRIRTAVVGDLSRDSLRSGYELAMQIQAGDSGAGVVDDDGNLVALVFARSTSRTAVTWATAMSEVQTVRNLRGVPEWDCTTTSERQLNLNPPQELALAGPLHSD